MSANPFLGPKLKTMSSKDKAEMLTLECDYW
jgi:hypothetical protein